MVQIPIFSHGLKLTRLCLELQAGVSSLRGLFSDEGSCVLPTTFIGQLEERELVHEGSYASKVLELQLFNRVTHSCGFWTDGFHHVSGVQGLGFVVSF